MIVPPHFTLWEAASSDRTQAFLLVGTLVLLPVILMYTSWSYGSFAEGAGRHRVSLKQPQQLRTIAAEFCY